MDMTAAASPSIPRPTPPSTTRNNEARDGIEVDRIYLRNNLRLYIREAWHVVEPSTVYLENWHIDLIAEHLEAVTTGLIKRFLINMPQNRRAYRFYVVDVGCGRANRFREAARPGT
jgi:hypothetical protein